MKIINIKTGAVEVNHELPFEKSRGVHPQFRRARVTAEGTYLLSFLGLDRVVEYDKSIHAIWSYNIDKPWAALRLKNGNTLITAEKNSLTREVNSKGETVWEFKCKTDLPRNTSSPPRHKAARGWPTETPSSPRAAKTTQAPSSLKSTPDKKVVWVLQDWKHIGDASAEQILDDPGIPEIPGQSEH